MYRALVHAAAYFVCASNALWAQNLGEPEGPVLLTVSGAITQTNAGSTAQFDLAMLEALEPTTIETLTIWTDEVHAFQGVSLADLVDHVGIEGSTLRAFAINDYRVDIPLSDAVAGGPILAYRIDGKTMSLREKGPLWVVYPYDSSPQYRTEVIYSRSIWQLDRLEAVE